MGTLAQKLQKLLSTKAGIKNAINGSGSTVGNNFSEYPTAITDGKALIAAAVTDKGVETAANATFQQIAGNIGQIETGSSGFTGMATVYLDPNLPCSYSYIDEKLALVKEENVQDVSSIQVPIPQIIYLSTQGRNENMSISGDFTLIRSDPYPQGRTIYIFGDVTVIAT